MDSDARLIYAPCIGGESRASLWIENAHSGLKVVRVSYCTFFLGEKNPDTFLMGSCSWNKKMCLWLAFSFSQDSRFILFSLKIGEKRRTVRKPLP